MEYLYAPWSWDDDYGETHKGIAEYRITKKTAKRIHYIRKEACPEWNEAPTIGFIDRQEFKTDTRCRADCPVGVEVTRCSKHRVSYPHCDRVHAFTDRWKGPVRGSP